MLNVNSASCCRAAHHFFIASLSALMPLPLSAETTGFEDLKSSNYPDRGIATQSVARINIRGDESRYITFVELESEEVYRSVMDCKDWRTRRFTVNRPRPYNQPSFFYENNASLNHIQIQAKYCPIILNLPLSAIDYEKGMKSQIWKDRSLLPSEYFLKCPQKDAEQWACIDYREEWKEQRWDPKNDSMVNPYHRS